MAQEVAAAVAAEHPFAFGEMSIVSRALCSASSRPSESRKRRMRMGSGEGGGGGASGGGSVCTHLGDGRTLAAPFAARS